MQPFRGKLMRNGQVVIDNIQGRLEVDVGPNRTERWNGFFSLPSGENVEREEPFELVLDDGRSGKIRVERVNQTAQGMSASFGSA
jgi:hypothetical protein